MNEKIAVEVEIKFHNQFSLKMFAHLGNLLNELSAFACDD